MLVFRLFLAHLRETSIISTDLSRVEGIGNRHTSEFELVSDVFHAFEIEHKVLRPLSCTFANGN